MAHIDYYFSTISPFTYLAGNSLEDVVAESGASVTYKPMDIVSLMGRTGGTPPPQRHPSRIEYRAQELLRISKAMDMPFNLKPAHWPTNAAPSSYAIIAAQNANGGSDVGGLVQSFLKAVWAEERDIAQDDVVRDCLEKSGFDPELANSGLLAGAETYARNLEEAVSAGVFGAPFYITDDDQRFWGRDRVADLAAHIAGK